jgi:hypothetical protein
MEGGCLFGYSLILRPAGTWGILLLICSLHLKRVHYAQKKVIIIILYQVILGEK